MRKFLILVLALALGCMQFANAAETDAANIKIKIAGATSDNRYFMCMEGIGCLSILAAQKGKVYPIFHSFNMDYIYIANLEDNFRLSKQGLPKSCDTTVNTNQTVTIYGKIQAKNGAVYVQNLHCTVA
ncbi:hypothetical protein [Aquicella lusitana]|uniref:Uncharacterized protein n=1 Tax=Aquicella lusitana TaxID=254246 RepID=A0A370GMF0_9COXI|nr:hypothetical protein [Aquicella lusitana]RDI44550.1 hypothetical protein C8D86_10932 [Aquicella lusitana]VVC72508.1 hypothetical protein AQULUS_02200 [Aquicella lusitana]